MKAIFKTFFLLVVFAGFAKTAGAQTAAILLFDSVQIIDYTGPYEVFGPAFKVITVSEKPGMLRTVNNMKVTADYSIDNSPTPDILVLPGGAGVRAAANNPRLITWIQEKTKTAKVVMSVCNGAFFLQRAGLLDGLTVTTTASFIDSLQALVPTAKVVRDKRFVDNGKIITTAGLTAGIDGALHVVGKLLGSGWEPTVARMEEYNWDPTSTYAAASLADNNAWGILRLFDFEIDCDALTYEGDKDKWHGEYNVRAGTSADSLFDRLNKEIVKRQHWALQKEDRQTTTSTWQFTGIDKANWMGELVVKAGNTAGLSNVRLRVWRL